MRKHIYKCRKQRDKTRDFMKLEYKTNLDTKYPLSPSMFLVIRKNVQVIDDTALLFTIYVMRMFINFFARL